MKRTVLERVALLTEQDIRKAISRSHCWSQVMIELGFPTASGGTAQRIREIICAKHQIDIEHFDPKKKNRKYSSITKICPVCGSEFETNEGQKGEKTTCSRRCSNTYFRSGAANGNYKDDSIAAYQTVCWRHHKHECVVCGEKLMVEAHHHNGKHDDNRPKNFVPLCPTHHQYWHSKHRHLIEEIVNAYVLLT